MYNHIYTYTLFSIQRHLDSTYTLLKSLENLFTRCTSIDNVLTAEFSEETRFQKGFFYNKILR